MVWRRGQSGGEPWRLSCGPADPPKASPDGESSHAPRGETVRNRPRAIYLGFAGTDQQASLDTLAAVREHFEIVFAGHFSFGDKGEQERWTELQADFLFSFGPLIVRKNLLESIRVAAINFHFAPPRWPGVFGWALAILEGDTEFGATAHIMVEEVDAGPILRVSRFPIEPDDTGESLRTKAIARIPDLARAVIQDLRDNNWEPKPSGERWERKALRRKEILSLMHLEPGVSESELGRKLRAFGRTSRHEMFPGPYVELHGTKFWYIKDRN